MELDSYQYGPHIDRLNMKNSSYTLLVLHRRKNYREDAVMLSL